MGAPEPGTPRFDDGWEGIESKDHLVIFGERLGTILHTTSPFFLIYQRSPNPFLLKRTGPVLATMMLYSSLGDGGTDGPRLTSLMICREWCASQRSCNTILVHLHV